MTTAEFFAERKAQLEAGVLSILQRYPKTTVGVMASDLQAGTKELGRVLEDMKARGLVTSYKRRWSLA